jgi:hypothetical protein
MRKLVLTILLTLASTVAIAPTAKAGELEAQAYALEYLGRSQVRSEFDLASISIAKDIVRSTPELVLIYAKRYCHLTARGYDTTEASLYIHDKIKIALAGESTISIAAGVRIATSGVIYAIERNCEGM